MTAEAEEVAVGPCRAHTLCARELSQAGLAEETNELHMQETHMRRGRSWQTYHQRHSAQVRSRRGHVSILKQAMYNLWN